MTPLAVRTAPRENARKEANNLRCREVFHGQLACAVSSFSDAPLALFRTL